MTPSKVLVTGATGFIGARLCERLALAYRLPYRALVRRFTKANRIARMGAEMVAGDLMRPETIAAALDGCDAVVHLAHSDDRSAPKETANLLRESLKARVQRFVHVSSMSVHGPNPGPESTREETATIRRYGEAYSDSKAAAEKAVQAAVRSDGLPAVVLRPTVVYGPYSPFVTSVVESARGGEVSLIDGGNGVCNAVYVDDVCDAIRTALTTEKGVGRSYFVTGDDLVTWGDFICAFAGLVDPPPRFRDVSSEEAQRYWHARRPTLRGNVRALARLAASPAFHKEVSAVPAVGAAITWAKRTLAKALSEEKKLELKARFQAPAPRAAAAPAPAWPNEGRLVRETCRVKFSNELARAVLGWRPRYDFPRGVRVTRTWLEFARLLTAQDG